MPAKNNLPHVLSKCLIAINNKINIGINFTNQLKGYGGNKVEQVKSKAKNMNANNK
ncbi:hypothetical protein GCM10011501_21810 [Thalassotalea profundi]|uniref:Uncharacterized protein n=1 Tax=Thalassotalea profundi TaxID=2036687 RepID=A0ABQ3IRW2_9GAMM|nr:hypothetical protein GCM10011501_21810 [Thalassotalea profundi]